MGSTWLGRFAFRRQNFSAATTCTNDNPRPTAARREERVRARARARARVKEVVAAAAVVGTVSEDAVVLPEAALAIPTPAAIRGADEDLTLHGPTAAAAKEGAKEGAAVHRRAPRSSTFCP